MKLTKCLMRSIFVRLLTSAILAAREKGLALDDSVAATAVLEGYAGSLEAGGNPFILEESHPELREMALSAEREPDSFWSELVTLPRVTPPKRTWQLLQRSLPDKSEEIAFTHRIAGVGKSWPATVCRYRLLQWRLGRTRGEGLAALGVGLGQGAAEGARLLRSAAQARGSSAGSILCRRGRVGRSATRPPLWKNQTGAAPEAAAPTTCPKGHGERDSQSTFGHIRSAVQFVARSNQPEAGLAPQGSRGYVAGDRTGLEELPVIALRQGHNVGVLAELYWGVNS